MRSRIVATLALMGLLTVTAIPLTASANDKATCLHEPAWGYSNPNMYRSWRQLHCGYGYNQSYFGGSQNYFGNGGWRPVAPAYGQVSPGYNQFAPAYSQYQGPRYYSNGWNNAYRTNAWNDAYRSNGLNNAYRANRVQNWHERLFHYDHHAHH
ncbi:MAG TPA: hypothetical protein VMD75_18670 [Candidatus Binataceae bacterium]|jgi:hypothetical protein|nr:hypothetical protein [Candidatus Binataceae bacterium]